MDDTITQVQDTASHLATTAKRYKRKLNKFQRPPRQSAHVRQEGKQAKPPRQIPHHVSGKKSKAPRVKSNHRRLKNQQKKGKKWNKRYVGQVGYRPAPNPPNTFFSSTLPLHLPYTASTPARRPPRPPGSPPSRPRAKPRPPPGPPPPHRHLPHVKSLPQIRNLEPFHLHEAVAPLHPPPSHVQEVPKPAAHVDHPPSHPHPIQHNFSPVNFNPVHGIQPQLKPLVHSQTIPLPSGPPPRTPGCPQVSFMRLIISPIPFICLSQGSITIPIAQILTSPTNGPTLQTPRL